MEFTVENLLTLFKNSINDGEIDQLLEFLCNSADEQYLDYVINKIADSIKQFLPLTPYIQSKVCNILNLIFALSEIAVFGADKSICLMISLLAIASDENCSVNNLRQVLTMLKNFFNDEVILQWSNLTEESLVGPLQLLGTKLPCIGDYECQSLLLETLWQMTNENRNFWAEMWFTCEKTRSMFLDLNADQFLLGCRKFLNYVNINQTNVRTYPFKASAVYLGSIQLKKPYRSEFWIDINFDTESISFFFSSLEPGNEETWETVAVSSDMVKEYVIEDKIEENNKELSITLNHSCDQLLSEDTSIAGLDSNLIRIRYWSFLDINNKIQTIFQGKEAERQIMPSSQLSRKRKVSNSAEVVHTYSENLPNSQHLKQKHISHKRKTSQSTELVCRSDHQEISGSQSKKRRVSESSQLVPVYFEDNEIDPPEYVVPASNSQSKARKYNHRKKVSSAFVDSEELGQLIYNKNVNLTKRDSQNAVPNKESAEILSPRWNSPKNNFMEPFADGNVDENYVINSEQLEKEQYIPKTSQNFRLIAACDITQRKSSQSMKEISSQQEVMNNLHSQSKPKSSQNIKLLPSVNITQRKSSQHSPVFGDTTTNEQPPISLQEFDNDALSPGREKEPDDQFEQEENQASPIMEPNADMPHSKKPKIDRRRHNEVPTAKNSDRSVTVTQNSEERKTELQKKRRKSAMTARKKNEIILNEKSSQGSLEGNQQILRQNKDSGFSQETDEYDVFALVSPKEKELLTQKRKFFESDENEPKVVQNSSKSSKRRKSSTSDKDTRQFDLDEYEFRVTPPQVKRRNRSVFVTDTETGSSEVSWFKKKNTLFETPTKCYSNRKKVKTVSQKKQRSKTKPRATKSNTKPKITRRSKASDSETRSKSALSELENFDLLVEKSAHLTSRQANMSGLYRVLESGRNLRHSNDEEGLNNDYPAADFDEFNDLHDHGNVIDSNIDNEYIENDAGEETSVRQKLKAVRQPISDEISDVGLQRKSTGRNKNKKYASCVVEDVDNVQRSTTKKRSKTNVKHVQKISVVDNAEGEDFGLNEIGRAEDEQYHTINKTSQQRSGKNNSKSTEKYQDKSNKNLNNVLVDQKPPSETINEQLDSNVGSVSEIEDISEYPQNKRHKSLLTEESLYSFNDEGKGKQIHLERYLDSLSSASINLQDYRTLGNVDTPQVIEDESHTNLATEKLNEDNSEVQVPNEETHKEPLQNNKIHSPEKFYIDFKMKKSGNVGEPLLQDKDEVQIAEGELNISNNYQFESPQYASTPKWHKNKKTNEDLLVKPSVLNILSDEVGNLTFRLFATLKKCMRDFREKMADLRESIVSTADAMISNEANFSESDLLSLAKNCRESRIHILKHLKKLGNMGNEYFESEKRNEKILAKKHKKAILKYSKSLQMAQSVAEKALEDRFTSKSRSLFESFLKQLELV